MTDSINNLIETNFHLRMFMNNWHLLRRLHDSSGKWFVLLMNLSEVRQQVFELIVFLNYRSRKRALKWYPSTLPNAPLRLIVEAGRRIYAPVI